jgi:hypothetical protein
VSKDIHLSWERYMEALLRIRARVAKGIKIQEHAEDECSVGFCSHTKAQWPDPQDYLWPDEPDRVVPKYRDVGQACPLDRSAQTPISEHNLYPSGCYHSCEFFRPKRVGWLPPRRGRKKKRPVFQQLTRERILALYDEQIRRTAEFCGWG